MPWTGLNGSSGGARPCTVMEALVLVLALAAPAAAQGNAPRERAGQLHLDVQPVGLAIGYATKLRSGHAVGGELGFGGNFLEYMLVGGRHFAEDSGIAYEDRDNATGPSLFEVLTLSAFVRHPGTARWQIDTGLRGSAFLHFDSSDDDPGGGLFGGLYAKAVYGGTHIKFGPRVMMGVFSEGNGITEFGIHLALILGRLTWGG